MWPTMVLESGNDLTDEVAVDFELPDDESAVAVVKVTSDVDDVDLEFNHSGGYTLTCNSGDIPEDIGSYIDLSYGDSVTSIATDRNASRAFTFKVLSFDANGTQYFP